MIGSLVNAIVKSYVVGKPVFAQVARTTDGKNILLLTLLSRFLIIYHLSINWSGSALSTFYAAIRKALVVVIVVRAIGVVIGLALAGWWVFKAE